MTINILSKISALILYMPIVVLGNLQWEIPGALRSGKKVGNEKIPNFTIGVKSLLFFFDSGLRVLTTIFCCKIKVLYGISIQTHFKIFSVRSIGAIGNVVQSVGMCLCGGDIFAVMRQARIPIVAVMRYFTLNDIPSYDEINYLWITMCASLSFVLSKDLGTEEFGLGMTLLIFSLIMRSLYYVLTEVFLKKELHNFNVSEKQTLVGIHDLIGYFIVIWIEIWMEKRDWNPLIGFFDNAAMSMCVLVNFSQNWLGIVITFWFDSMILQLLNTVGTGLTWIMKLMYKPSEWKLIKIPILLILINSVVAYTCMNNKRKNIKNI